MRKNGLLMLVLLAAGFQGVASAGLLGSYYESESPGQFTALVATQWDLGVDHDWGTGGPGVLGGRVDLFAIRWEGHVRVATPGPYTFYSVTDDGARLFVNGEPVIDKWVDQGATEHAGSLQLAAGDHEIVFEYYENTGGALCRLYWSGPGIIKQVIPPSAFVQPAQGFSAEFFNGTDPLSRAPVCVANVPAIAFDWGDGAPAPSVPANYFSARFQGWFIAPEMGTYTFTVASDDGSDLYIGGTPVVQNFAYPQPLTENSGAIALDSGQRYLVDLRYAELGGNAACYLYWQSPSMESRALLGEDTVSPAMRVLPALGRLGQLRRLVGTGADLTLGVQVEQPAATPAYEWRFKTAGDSGAGAVVASGVGTDGGVITLPLIDIALTGAGEYRCVVDDGRGPVASPAFTIEVVDELPAGRPLWAALCVSACALFVLRRRPARRGAA